MVKGQYFRPDILTFLPTETPHLTRTNGMTLSKRREWSELKRHVITPRDIQKQVTALYEGDSR